MIDGLRTIQPVQAQQDPVILDEVQLPTANFLTWEEGHGDMFLLTLSFQVVMSRQFGIYGIVEIPTSVLDHTAH